MPPLSKERRPSLKEKKKINMDNNRRQTLAWHAGGALAPAPQNKKHQMAKALWMHSCRLVALGEPHLCRETRLVLEV